MEPHFALPYLHGTTAVANVAAVQALRKSGGSRHNNSKLHGWICAQVYPLQLPQLGLVGTTTTKVATFADDVYLSTASGFDNDPTCMRIGAGEVASSMDPIFMLHRKALLSAGSYVRAARLVLLGLKNGRVVMTTITTVGSVFHAMMLPVTPEHGREHSNLRSDPLFVLAEAQLEAGCLLCARATLASLLSTPRDENFQSKIALIFAFAWLCCYPNDALDTHLSAQTSD